MPIKSGLASQYKRVEIDISEYKRVEIKVANLVVKETMTAHIN